MDFLGETELPGTPCPGYCYEKRNEPQNWVCSSLRLLARLGEAGLLLLYPSMVEEEKGVHVCARVRMGVCACVQLATHTRMSQGSAVKRERWHMETGDAKHSTNGTRPSFPHPDTRILSPTLFCEPRASAVLLTF